LSYPPIIGLDENFLEGYYGCELLNVIENDQNDHNVLIEVENKDSWL